MLDRRIAESVVAVHIGVGMITDARVTAYLNTLEAELPEYLQTLFEDAQAREVPVIRRETQTLLRFLVHAVAPMRILEIGTAIGFSALFMGLHMPADAVLTTIEKVPARIAEAKKNIAQAVGVVAGAERLQVREGDAEQQLRQLCDENNDYDFIFLDAAKAQYPAYLPYLLRLLARNGYLVTDNVLQDGSIAQSKFTVERRDRTIHMRLRDYLYTLTHTDGIETVILPVGDGVAVTRVLTEAVTERGMI